MNRGRGCRTGRNGYLEALTGSSGTVLGNDRKGESSRATDDANQSRKPVDIEDVNGRRRSRPERDDGCRDPGRDDGGQQSLAGSDCAEGRTIQGRCGWPHNEFQGFRARAPRISCQNMQSVRTGLCQGPGY
jgi:hypothetical protein